MHSLRPKAINKLGLGYDAVRAIRSDIIYCGAYGFGEKGPYRDKAAYDDIIQAGSGLAALHIPSRGEPAFMPTVLCDKLSGQAIAYSVIAALFQRERGGGGQAIEVPMFETTAEFAYIEHLLGFAFEPPLGPTGYVRVVSPRRKPFRTADGYMCILPYSDRNWRDFFEFVGRPDLKTDARFYPLTERVAHLETLYELIEAEAPKRPTAEWVAFCDEVSIPCMPVLSLEQLPDDEHMKAVGMFGLAEHPSEGAYKTIRAPVSFSSAPFRIRRHAPRLGEHTEEILEEIGVSRRRWLMPASDPAESEQKIMTESVTYEQDGGVVTLTLNEPDTRNALSPAIVDALVAHCSRINQDMSVSCVIVTGAGESFSSGGNVKEMRDRTGLFGGTPAEIRRGYHHGIQKNSDGDVRP